MVRIERTTDSKELKIDYTSEDSIQDVTGLVTRDGKTHTLPLECCYTILDKRGRNEVRIRINGKKSELEAQRKRGDSKKSFTGD